MLGENASLVRFWTNSFPKYIKPHRNAKGNRQFTKEDIEVLKQLHLLIRGRGMSVEDRVKALDSLKEIRRQLEEIRSGL